MDIVTFLTNLDAGLRQDSLDGLLLTLGIMVLVTGAAKLLTGGAH